MPQPLSRRPRVLDLLAHAHIAASMGLFTVLFVPQGLASTSVGSTLPFVAAWGMLYLCIIAFFLLNERGVTRKTLWLLLAVLAVISTSFWSSNPRRTLLYGLSLAMNFLFIGLLLRYYSVAGFCRLCVHTILVMCLVGVGIAAVGCEAVRHFDPHSRTTLVGTLPLRGLFNHKITAAFYASLGAVFAVCLFRRVQRWLSVVVLCAFTVLTGSSIGLGVFVAAVAIAVITRVAVRVRFSPQLFLFVLVVLAAAGITVTVYYLPAILRVLRRDPTLTGRTLLWAWGIVAFLEKPLLGWGYLGYLDSAHAADYRQRIASFRNYDVPHFHNSYIQVSVEFGIIGLSFFVLLLIVSIVRQYRAALCSEGGSHSAAVSALILVIGAGVFMNLSIQYNDFTTLFILFAALGQSTGAGRHHRGTSMQASWRIEDSHR